MSQDPDVGQLFPPGVVTVTATPEMAAAPLLPEEEALVRRAVRKRRREFAAGRACARAALAELGIKNFPLISDPNRAPVWPPSVVGSLTHCDGFCGVAVAPRGTILGLGFDAEVAEPLPVEMIPRICTPSEAAWTRTAPSPATGDWHKLIFSAKESVYKCYFPLTRAPLDFCDIEIQIEPTSWRFSVELLKELCRPLPSRTRLLGRFLMSKIYIFTAVTLTSVD